MRRLLLCLLLIGCSSPTKGVSPSGAPAGGSAAGDGAGGAPAPSQQTSATPPLRELAVYPEPWNPSEPVELASLATRRMFVTAEASALCPTREQAEARECGNSVEFPEQGLALDRGEDVLVVGDAPFDGHWRAIRYQVSGTLPAWIRADDVSERPNLDALDAFAARPDVTGAVAVDDMKAEDIHKLEPGTLVTFQRKTGLRFARHGRANSYDEEGGTMLYVPTRRHLVAVQLVEDPEAPPRWMEHHPCLVYGDCLTLGYVCAKEGYCDEVSILARVTPVRVPPPEDEEGEWPAKWSKRYMPLLVGVAVADRFGTFEFQKPDWASSW